MMYPGAFEELYEGLKNLYKEIADEELAMNERFIETRQPFTPMEMAHYNKLEGAGDILQTILGIMADAMRLEKVKDGRAN